MIEASGVSVSRFRVSCFGFRAKGFRVEGSRFWILGFGVEDLSLT